MLRTIFVLIFGAFFGLLLVTSSMLESTVIVVPAGGDFQAALNSARYGDTIILQAGARYLSPCGQCSFVLPYKGTGTNTAADYITIRSSNVGALPAGQVSAADAVNMAKIVAVGGRGAIQVEANAKWYKFVGIEITNQSSGTGEGVLQAIKGLPRRQGSRRKALDRGVSAGIA
jgi:hypothetical protein